MDNKPKHEANVSTNNKNWRSLGRRSFRARIGLARARAESGEDGASGHKGSNNLGRLKGATVWDVISRYLTELQPASLVLASLPVTQVSVERVYSAMKLLTSRLRPRLKNDIVEAMLLLRSNQDWD